MMNVGNSGVRPPSNGDPGNQSRADIVTALLPIEAVVICWAAHGMLRVADRHDRTCRYSARFIRMHTDKATGRFKGYAHVHFDDEDGLDRCGDLGTPYCVCVSCTGWCVRPGVTMSLWFAAAVCQTC
jgi:hypothetical protein